jgi:anti-sigma B factor antagonist
MAARLDISIECIDRWTVATVSGELDMASAPDLESACSRIDGDLAIDLSRVDFVDSSGLAVLLRLDSRRGELIVLQPSEVVLRLLEITKVSNHFDLRESLP